jgi:hypothetical protein
VVHHKQLVQKMTSNHLHYIFEIDQIATIET